MPLLFKVRIPLRQKLGLIVLFSSGIFVMTATILRSYYSLKSIETLPVALGWADREEFVAILVACVPGIKPLFNNTRWFATSTVDRTSSKVLSGYKHSNMGTNTSVSNARATNKAFEMNPMSWRRNNYGTQRLSSGTSDERVIMNDTLDTKALDDPKDIFITQEYTVSSEDAGNKV